MGSSTEIQDTNLDITKFRCPQCRQPFTEQDKANNNWDLWWDTSNDIKFKEFSRGRNWLRLNIYVRDLTHKFSYGEVNGKPWYNYDCPESKEVENV